MKYSIIILFLSVCLCTNAVSQKKNETNSWMKFHGLKSAEFVQLGEPGKLNMNKSPYNISNLETFRKFLMFSPDSARFIDLDSYSLALETDSAGKYYSYGSDIDSKVQLISLSDSSSITILFCGTLCYPEAALWTSKNEFEIYGFHVLNTRKYIPTIWKVNTELNTMTYLQYKSYLELEPKNYVQQVRLKEINFISR